VTHQAPTHHPRMSHNDRPLPCLGQRQRRRLPNRGHRRRPAPDRACPSRARQAQPASRPGLHQPALERDVLQVEVIEAVPGIRPKCIPVLVHRPPGAVERSARSRPSRAPLLSTEIGNDPSRSGDRARPARRRPRTQPPSPGADRSGQHGGSRLRSPMMRRTCTAPVPGTRAPESQARSSSGQKMGKRTFSHIAGGEHEPPEAPGVADGPQRNGTQSTGSTGGMWPRKAGATRVANAPAGRASISGRSWSKASSKHTLGAI